MTLQSFGDQLRQQRQQKKISLEYISAATRINVKLLESIEAGNFSHLPQAYIRAFLREYALAIDLPPDAVLQQYTELTQTDDRTKQQSESPQSSVPSQEPVRQHDGTLSRIRFSQQHIILGALVLGAGLLFVYLSSSGPEVHESKVVTEVPFDRVVHESEATLTKHEPARPDVFHLKPTAPDSLTLELVSTDSVWISLLIDKKKSEEYLFPPNWRRSWKAKEEFLITMGNAGGATFWLNGVELGALGRRGSVVRNVPIREAMLPKR